MTIKHFLHRHRHFWFPAVLFLAKYNPLGCVFTTVYHCTVPVQITDKPSTTFATLFADECRCNRLRHTRLPCLESTTTQSLGYRPRLMSTRKGQTHLTLTDRHTSCYHLEDFHQPVDVHHPENIHPEDLCSLRQADNLREDHSPRQTDRPR